MKGIANIFLIVTALTVLAVVLGVDSLWYFAAWLAGLTIGIIMLTVLVALHRRLITRWMPYWWVVESVRYPFIRRRVLRDIATATDEQLERSFRLLFNKNTPQTWFVEKTAMAISEEWSRREGFDIIKEMQRRHKELKRN